MAGKRNPKVTVRHPKLGKELVVRKRQAEVMAKSGWEIATGKTSTPPPAANKEGLTMAAKTYDGNYKAYLLAVAPADWAGEEEGDREITSSEITAGTRLLRLLSSGGIGFTFSTNTASQALLDKGKTGHSVGTREISGGQIVHERHFPVDEDDMWALYAYGDKRWLVISPDGEPSAGDILHVLEVEVGETELIQPDGDTYQNFQVVLAVQDWDLRVVVAGAG